MFEEAHQPAIRSPSTARLRAMMRQCKERSGIDRGCPCLFPTDCHIPTPEALELMRQIRNGDAYETWPPRCFES